MNRRGEVDQSTANSLGQQNNNEVNHNNSNMPVSKTAAFFHPRPVMALMPYKQFFSPIACPDDDCSDVMLDDERKQSANENHNVGAPLLRNSQAQQEYDFQQRQQQQQNLTPAEDNLANINHTTQEDHQGSTNSSSPQPPSSNLKPKDLFSSFIAKPISNHNSTANAFKVPPKQSKLVKDSNTGQMKSSLTNDNNKNNSKKSSWDDYGGRPTVDNADNKKENASNKDATKKKKKKKKSKQQSDGTDITDYLNGNKKRVSNEKNAKTKTKKKSKKQRKSNTTSTGTELDIPAYNTDDILLTNIQTKVYQS